MPIENNIVHKEVSFIHMYATVIMFVSFTQWGGSGFYLLQHTDNVSPNSGTLIIIIIVRSKLLAQRETGRQPYVLIELDFRIRIIDQRITHLSGFTTSMIHVFSFDLVGKGN